MPSGVSRSGETCPGSKWQPQVSWSISQLGHSCSVSPPLWLAQLLGYDLNTFKQQVAEGSTPRLNCESKPQSYKGQGFSTAAKELEEVVPLFLCFERERKTWSQNIHHTKVSDSK